jgi:hypothetical protein
MFTCPSDHADSENPLHVCYFGVLVLPSENARSDTWNAGEFTPRLKEGKGLFDNNTFVQFFVTTTRFHHSSCQILVTEFVPAFQRDT